MSNISLANRIILRGAIGGMMLLAGCSETARAPKQPERKTFTVSYRPYAPQPVYSRVRWVYLPDVVPAKELSAAQSGGTIDPVVQLQLRKSPLPEAVTVLANILRYRAECPESLASVRVSINAVGTVEELATQLSKSSGEQIVVDHAQKVVGIAGASGLSVTPELYQESGTVEQHYAPGAIIKENGVGNESGNG